jgi:hypothetical protein
MNLDQIVTHVTAVGPKRVCVNRFGDGQVYEYVDASLMNVVFIRKDGWTLGALPGVELVAKKLWEKDWVAVMFRAHAHETWQVSTNVAGYQPPSRPAPKRRK